MAVMIGTSGWQYRSWKDAFYQGAKQADWLERYAEAFATVEVNNAFYRLPARSTFEDWARRTPDDFVMAVKMSRYLTHIKRLKEPDEPVKRFFSRAEGLGGKLGPVLVQLPPTFQMDCDRLDGMLRQMPAHVRVVVEPRHASWFVDRVRAVLERHDAALCLADSPHRKTPLWRTTEWGYVRLHEGRATPKPCYGRDALHTWAGRLAEIYGDAEVYAYFNNDTNACAVRDAGVLAHQLDRVGISSTRTPRPADVLVG
jgi:uncharacterized protein YecE (DUF72 family)